VVQKYALAFGVYKKGGKIIVGGDSRTSGAMIRNLVKGCLAAAGCPVIDVGIVSTPTVQMEIIRHKAAGGIAITASHNPSQWNGLKFMDANARFLSPDKAAEVYRLADQPVAGLAAWDSLGSETKDSGANHAHIGAILDLKYLSVPELQKRKFKVVVDCVNGAGGTIIPGLLDALGCQATIINGEPSGIFAHTPEPLPEHLTGLSKAVLETGADIGFAVDPDVDRCAIIDNTGRAIGEEYTLAAAVKFILSRQLGPVVVNMSTSRASEDIARYYNCPFTRTKVGEINVAEEMAACDAVVGGEGNGGVILPDLHLGRDAPLAIALTLQHLLESGGTMHELFLSLPQYQIVKHKIDIEGIDPDAVLDQMAERHKDKQINFLDGLKIDDRNTWVHLRKSNTEPIIRVMAEAPTGEEADSLAAAYLKEIREMAGVRDEG
jgi:phosphomannomutase